MDPDAVAEQIVVAMERNQGESYLGRQAWWVNLGRRMRPSRAAKSDVAEVWD